MPALPSGSPPRPELPSPPARRLSAPRWLDGRLALGVLLVLVSVLLGARVVAAADHSERVWVAARDLAAGSTLSDGDLRAQRVTLYGDHGRYLSAESGTRPTGRVLSRAVGAGEFVPAAALTDGDLAATRLVTVPVKQFHLPPDRLRNGQRVDVYVTVKPAGGATPAAPQLVLAAALVVEQSDSGSRFGGGSSDLGVVLRVPEEKVAALVAAIQAGQIDLVRVPLDAAASS